LVASQEFVLAQHPEIPGPRCWSLGQFRDSVFIRQPLDRFLRGEQAREFLILETHEAHVEALVLKGLDFDAKHLVVPAGVFCQLIIGNDVRAFLRLGQMIQHDHGNLGQPKLPRGEQTTMAGEYSRLRVHQNRVVKAELRDAGSDLGNLGFCMSPRVPGPGNQLVDQPHLDVLGHPVQIHDCVWRH